MIQFNKSTKLINKIKLEFLEIKYYKFVNSFKIYMWNENKYNEFFMIFWEFLLYHLVRVIKADFELLGTPSVVNGRIDTVVTFFLPIL